MKGGKAKLSSELVWQASQRRKPAAKSRAKKAPAAKRAAPAARPKRTAAKQSKLNFAAAGDVIDSSGDEFDEPQQISSSDDDVPDDDDDDEMPAPKKRGKAASKPKGVLPCAVVISAYSDWVQLLPSVRHQQMWNLPKAARESALRHLCQRFTVLTQMTNRVLRAQG